MSRYIDADALITKLKEYNPQTSKVKVAQMVVGNLPSIDIVRCRDCRRRPSCVTFEGIADYDGFCSMGVRDE